MRQILFLVLLTTACTRPIQTSETSDSLKIELTPIMTSVSPQTSVHRVLDSLTFYMTHGTPVSRSLYKEIFGEDLSGSDTVYVRSLIEPVKNVNGVVIVYKSIECDSRYTWVGLYLFDNNWQIKGSLSLETSSGVEMYSQNYDFINDSTLEINATEGLDYDMEDYIKTIARIQLNEKKLFDTIMIQVDTIRSN
jgi:hypothetical protein